MDDRLSEIKARDKDLTDALNLIMGARTEVERDRHYLLTEIERLQTESDAAEADINKARPCNLCDNWNKCDPDKPEESKKYKFWRECYEGARKGNIKCKFKWRGVK